MRKRFVILLVLSAMSLGSAASAASTTQGGNTSDGAAATSGDSGGTNSSTFSGGPGAQGSASGSAQQTGSNRGAAEQRGRATSGDTVAGSQVTGAVADDVTVQNQNASSGSAANSGETDMFNELNGDGIVLGPAANGDDAQASQIGDNALEAVQSAAITSGDAVAGSQVTGAVAIAGGFVTVQNQQSSDGDVATVANDSEVGNAIFADLGPFALGSSGSAEQIGDNVAAIEQAQIGATGDGVAGSQVTGTVGYDQTTIQNTNNATGAEGNAGEIGCCDDNAIDVEMGPNVERGKADTASAAQIGDNQLDIVQDIALATGDAVAGSQVTGAVAPDGATVTVQNSNAATDVATNSSDEAGSVDCCKENDFDVEVGPQATGANQTAASQNGDNALAADILWSATTGDSVAGSQVTGVVTGSSADITLQHTNKAVDAVSNESSEAAEIDCCTGNVPISDIGPVSEGVDTAVSSQVGDNVVDLIDVTIAQSGDSVAGSQVAGAVAGDGSTLVVQNTNSADAVVANFGREAAGVDCCQGEQAQFDIGPFARGDGQVSATQNGDNALAADQSMTLSTGDAVGGSQVTGAVSGAESDVTIQVANSASEVSVNAGSEAAEIDCCMDLGVDGQLGPESSGGTSASSSHVGDNTADLDATLSMTTGDAVGGSQVSGIVGGDSSDVTVQATNTADTIDVNPGSESAGVDCCSELETDITAGAVARSGLGGPAQASQAGDNAVTSSQSVAASTGDAVGGSQVTGIVAGDDSRATVQNSNAATVVTVNGAEAAAIGDGVNDLHADLGAEADAEGAGPASAEQIGDNTLSAAQASSTSTGDAVGGSQVTGIVTGDDSEATAQNSNTADRISVASGEVESGDKNDIEAAVGPQASSPTGPVSAAQIGDDVATISQATTASTGDAVGGSQVTGIVGGTGTDAEVQVSNAATDIAATTGALDGLENVIEGHAGPDAEAETDGVALSSQNGGTLSDVAQTVDLSSGDALAGAQVAGTVGA